MSKTNDEIIAIFVADIHLQHNPPIWRSAEEDWYDAMRRPLLELTKLKQKHNCPIICAGDVFDKWNSPPELINFAACYMPQMIAIPGQHDLPQHNYEDIMKSAYWTLVNIGVVKTMDIKNSVVRINNVILHAFPFGSKIKKQTENTDEGDIHIAIAHEYIHMKGHSYPGAPEENKYSPTKANASGYNIIVYGDNHKGFKSQTSKSTFFNCGTFMRRKSDEINYKPQVGLLRADGEIEVHYLDTSQDRYISAREDVVEEEMDMGEFIEELEKLGNTALDFTEAMKQFFKTHKTIKEVKQIILKAMETK